MDQLTPHPHEPDRLESLRSYGIVGADPDTRYDELIELARRACGTPTALISFVDADQLWFLAGYRDQAQSLVRAGSFCELVVTQEAPLVVRDARDDSRFRAHPNVTGPPYARAYAGVPIVGRDGLPLGTVCALDHEAHAFDGQDLRSLTAVAESVVALLELRRLDVALGRHRFPQAEVEHDHRRLRRALDDGELVPHFQPIVDLRTAEAVELEALLRWEHPELGTIPPTAFLPSVEASGLMLPVGRHVLRSALDVVPDGLSMAVNVSPSQLVEHGYAADVLAELERRELPGDCLTLEITESFVLSDSCVARTELALLRAAGVGIAIDDYGAGYSAVMRVLELPVTSLKLDRDMTWRVPDDARARTVVASTLDMAEQLGLTVIAEGIETAQQRETLLGMGCRFGQGYLFGRPRPR